MIALVICLSLVTKSESPCLRFTRHNETHTVRSLQSLPLSFSRATHKCGFLAYPAAPAAQIPCTFSPCQLYSRKHRRSSEDNSCMEWKSAEVHLFETTLVTTQAVTKCCWRIVSYSSRIWRTRVFTHVGLATIALRVALFLVSQMCGSTFIIQSQTNCRERRIYAR